MLATAPDRGADPPILSALYVVAGFETAVGAVFEDELAAPVADNEPTAAASFWGDLPQIENAAGLPEGARPLADVITAPQALARSLAYAGWVESEEAGRRLQRNLVPGQRLVDRQGRMWRWDGFTRIAPGPSPAAELLRHKNRLAVLADEIAKDEEASQTAEQSAAEARAARQRAAEADRLRRSELRTAEAAAAAARSAEAEIARRALLMETRVAGAAAAIEAVAADLAETRAQDEETERELAALPDPALARAALDAARLGLAAQLVERHAGVAFLAARFARREARRVQRCAGERRIGKRGHLAVIFLVLGSGLGKIGGDGLDCCRGSGETRLHHQPLAFDLRLCGAGCRRRLLRRAQFRPLLAIGLGCALASGAGRGSTLLGHAAGFLRPRDLLGEHDETILVAQ